MGNVTTERGPAGGGGGGAAPPKLNVDWAFLGEREGYRRDMYVPTKDGAVIDQSGPTIGKGVDLGQMNPADLRALNLSPELEARLSPYLGKRKQAAFDFVEAHPLVLSDADLDALYAGVRDREVRRLVEKYDAASQVGRFSDLPRDTQTAIASLYWQYGTGNPAKRTPNYWRQITTGDWEGALSNLNAFGDAYQSRRDLEAKLLQRDLSAGTLPRRPR